MTAFWHYFHHLSEDKTHYWSTLTGSVIRALLITVENDIQQMPHKNVKPQNVNHEYRERLGGLGVIFLAMNTDTEDKRSMLWAKLIRHIK